MMRRSIALAAALAAMAGPTLGGGFAHVTKVAADIANGNAGTSGGVCSYGERKKRLRMGMRQVKRERRRIRNKLRAKGQFRKAVR